MFKAFDVRRNLILVFCILIVAVLLHSRCTPDSDAKAVQVSSTFRTINHSEALSELDDRKILEEHMRYLKKRIEEELIKRRDAAIDEAVASWGTGVYIVEKSDGKYVFVNVGNQTIAKIRYFKRR